LLTRDGLDVSAQVENTSANKLTRLRGFRFVALLLFWSGMPLGAGMAAGAGVVG
jgi:hypothetical protein